MVVFGGGGEVVLLRFWKRGCGGCVVWVFFSFFVVFLVYIVVFVLGMVLGSGDFVFVFIEIIF